LTVGKFTAVPEKSTRKPEFAGATQIVYLGVAIVWLYAQPWNRKPYTAHEGSISGGTAKRHVQRRVAPPNGTFDGDGKFTAVPEQFTRKPESAGATRIVHVEVIFGTCHSVPADGWADIVSGAVVVSHIVIHPF